MRDHQRLGEPLGLVVWYAKPNNKLTYHLDIVDSTQEKGDDLGMVYDWFYHTLEGLPTLLP